MSASTLAPRSRTVAAPALAAAILGALLLAGCSSSSSDDGGPAADRAQSAAGDDSAGTDTGDGGAAEQGPDSMVAVTVAETERMIARDASLTLSVDDLEQSAAQVRAMATAADGWVISEELYPGADEEDGWGVIVVTVPSSSLDSSLTRLDDLGTITERVLTSADVTEQYVDTAARLDTMQASVTRVRELMDEAGSLDDIVALESELAAREADLDALTARLQSLEGDVSHSSITVTLTEETAPEQAQQAGGFGAGLSSGWDAFVATVAVGLTAFGAVLPFLVAVALVAVPVWAVLRRRRPQGTMAG